LWNELATEGRQAVEVAERYLEGEANAALLREAYHDLLRTFAHVPSEEIPEATFGAIAAVFDEGGAAYSLLASSRLWMGFPTPTCSGIFSATHFAAPAKSTAGS